MFTNALRHRRTDVGLSQSRLAALSGVTRQALIAIEAGRQVPSTELALKLARALRCQVEDLFSLTEGSLTAELIESSPSARVVVGRVDGQWVAHPVTDPARPVDAVVVGARDSSSSVEVELLAGVGDLEHNALVAGCAPLLGLLAGRLGRRPGDARATWLPANSMRSLEWLARGWVHAAGLHLTGTTDGDGHASIVRARFSGQSMLLVNLTTWRQGFVVAPGNPLGIRTAKDLGRPDVRVVHREAGSGAQALLQAQLQDGFSAVPVTARATDHDEVARLVRWGVADVGMAIEAAAVDQALDFVPVAEERFDVVVPAHRLDVPAVARLLDLIDAPTFRAEASRLPGYDLSRAGHAETIDGGARK